MGSAPKQPCKRLVWWSELTIPRLRQKRADPRACWPSNLAWLMSFRQTKDPVSKEVNDTFKHDSQGHLLDSPTCKHTHMHLYEQTYICILALTKTVHIKCGDGAILWKPVQQDQTSTPLQGKSSSTMGPVLVSHTKRLEGLCFAQSNRKPKGKIKVHSTLFQITAFNAWHITVQHWLA